MSKKLVSQTKNLNTLLSSHKWVNKVVLVLAVLLLFLTCLYGAEKSSKYYAYNSDATVYAYLLGDGLDRHTIVLPSQHTNILKLPIFYLQSLFPYHYHSYMTLSILLTLVSVGAWAYLLIKLFGREYRILILILFSALLFSSVVLNLNIVETTVRNIEFPIALWFVFIASRVLLGKKHGRRGAILATIGCILYGLTIAGDNYFEYAISLPILIAILWYWIQSHTFTKQMFHTVALVIGVSLGAVLFKSLLLGSGLIVGFKTGFALTVVTQHNLVPSITTAINQLFEMQNANILGRAVHIANLSVFLNCGVLILGIIGFILILVRSSKDYRKAKAINIDNGFIFTVISLSFFVTFLVYIMSGQVVQTLKNGRVVSLGQDRYLALLSFLIIVGFIWLIKTYYSKNRLLSVLIVMIAIVAIFTAYIPVRNSYDKAIIGEQPGDNSISSIVADLNKDGVKEILTSYWWSTPIRFWSNNSIDSAPIINCNTPETYNVREDWYKSQGYNKTALVIDRPDPIYWDCSDKTIMSIYGVPSKIQVVPGNTPKTYEEIWVYNYDVRDRLTHLKRP